jgi:hypothetical protein
MVFSWNEKLTWPEWISAVLSIHSAVSARGNSFEGVKDLINFIQ